MQHLINMENFYRMFRKTPAFRRGDVRNGFDFDLALYSEYLYNTPL
jgi:hypothetical protein